ncbi:MAG: hypothetical protein ACE5IZ_05230 [Dehalococcoidia bacterium]
MEIEFLIIADAVEATNGKLYVLGGGWNQWKSPSFPTQVRMGIAVGILVPWNETNEKHHVTIDIVDADGKAVLPPINAEVEVGRPPGLRAGTTQRAILAINSGFPLQSAGSYEVKANVDGGSQKAVTFDAILIGAPSIQIR